MRALYVLVAALVVASLASARVWTTVYRCDETTPLAAVDPNHPTIYRDIMVGTRLVLVVGSDGPGIYGDHQLWSGGLVISRDDWQRGTLSGRGYNQQRRNYDGSALFAAATQGRASVQYREYFQPDTGYGFDLRPNQYSSAGDWFVFDYHAERPGSCDVALYDFHASLDMPLETLSFTHVPSRDFNGDTIVTFWDLALLASRCGTVVGSDPNDPAAPLDLDCNGRIDLGDIAAFSEYWLERTDCGKPMTDPTKSSPSL
ncbi:MAG: hypothetical protein M1376_22630 [Planctomycetes bacterium]|nr:hypothetical protein [Planctomycetota bacterium]